MDDFDRESNASSSEPEDELMADAEEQEQHNQRDQQAERDHDEDENENENDNDDDDDDDDEDHDDDDEEDNNNNTQQDHHEHVNGTADNRRSGSGSPQPDGQNSLSQPTIKRTSATPGPSSLTTPKWAPMVRPEVLNARTYDIVPTMAAPMSTSINALSVTPDLRYWMTGGSDGYIRKYDGPGTINGKQQLTVAQRHPFVDSVTKAGILMSYWENAEPHTPNMRSEDQLLSPVYSLAVHSEALWLLSGLESGGINLQSVRHDEGKRITCLQQHTNAVSVLTLAADEKSVLSGSWDKNIFDWDLNTGKVKRSFDGSGGQVSALETRPMGGCPVPPEASEEDISDTFFSNNDAPIKDDFDFSLDGVNNTATDAVNGDLNSTFATDTNGAVGDMNGAMDAQGSPAHDSLFGSPAAGSDLFGDNFGGDDDNEFSRAMMQDSAQENMEAAQDNTAMPEFDMSLPSFDGMNNDASNTAVTADSTHELGTTTEEPTQQEDTTTLNGSFDSTLQPPLESQAITEDASTQPELLTQPHEADAPGTPSALFDPAPESPSMLFAEPPATHYDTSQTSDSTFLSASMDGTLRIWDRRVPNPIARIGTRPGVPPGAWAPAGPTTATGSTVAKARGGRQGWQPERVFRFPGGSGPVSCLRPMANGRHLICASHDILRLYDLRAQDASARRAPPPFLIVPGPPRAGVISSLYIDQTSRFMLSAAGTRGWEGTNTEVLIGYEINVPPSL
ncbi:transcription factor SPT8 [Apiospora kogelbergensis]|uniref:transcription factor SPT8 n=1 Tax=Apiospora kogelbergensis TaxID=1337665 RepID=UPI00312F4EAA